MDGVNSCKKNVNDSTLDICSTTDNGDNYDLNSSLKCCIGIEEPERNQKT